MFAARLGPPQAIGITMLWLSTRAPLEHCVRRQNPGPARYGGGDEIGFSAFIDPEILIQRQQHERIVLGIATSRPRMRWGLETVDQFRNQVRIGLIGHQSFEHNPVGTTIRMQ